MSNNDLVDFTKGDEAGQPSFFDTLRGEKAKSEGASNALPVQADGTSAAGPRETGNVGDRFVVPDGACAFPVEGPQPPAQEAETVGLSGRRPSETPQQVSPGFRNFVHLEGVAPERATRGLNEVIRACGLRIEHEAGKIIVSEREGFTQILALAEDGVGSAKSLIELAMVKVLSELNCEPYYPMVSLKDRAEAINEMAPFDGVPFGGSHYDHYVLLCKESDVEQTLHCYSLDHYRDDEGKWDSIRLISDVRAADEHTEAVLMLDVDDEDLNTIVGLPFTVYFRARQQYVARSWIQKFGNIKIANRKIPSEYDDGPRNSVWLVSEQCATDVRTHPLVVGPESRETFFSVRDTLLSAAKANRFLAPLEVPRILGPELEPVPREVAPVVAAPPQAQLGGGGAGQDKRFWLDKLSVNLRPTRDEYVLFTDAVRAGAASGLALIAQREIRGDNKDIFREALNSHGKIAPDYRTRLSSVRGMDCDPITRFHAVIDVFSSCGRIPEPNKHIAKPVPAAIFQMIRAYNAYALKPTIDLDFEWCLSA